ncbi:hypothetical protein ACFV30_27035 [Streptomyces sp. NPDC059752]|uniref:hypothetical protein n=1 Tax=unclassified Streptomyces TaxID=2593676 RepID=UPI00364A25EE
MLRSPAGFVGLDTAEASVQWRQWLASPEAELLSITDVLSHETEGSVWYTANTRRLLHGVAINGDDEDVRYVSCVWEMKVLFSANGGDEAPTLLTAQRHPHGLLRPVRSPVSQNSRRPAPAPVVRARNDGLQCTGGCRADHRGMATWNPGPAPAA